MHRALILAERGWGRVHPNPLVGAVVVREGEVVGEGWHAEFGEAHAERMALDAAGDAARGATLYVTLEPCAHHGQQPPCTERILASGVARVVIAASDPNPLAAGGAGVLQAAGVVVQTGVRRDEARRLNARFLHRFADRSIPLVSIKLAVTMDGFIADASGASRWISGSASREWVHRLRANTDAIAVGGRTAHLDHSRLNVRGAITPRIAPKRVVFDRSSRLPGAHPMFADGGAEVIVVTDPAAASTRRGELAHTGVTVIGAASLGDALSSLADAGIDSLLVEGGGRLAGALLEAELVHRIYQIQCPLWLGEGHRAWVQRAMPIDAGRRWHTVERVALDDDTVLVLER